MNMKDSKRLLIILAAIYWIFAIGIYAISYEQFRYSPVNGKEPVADAVIGEVLDEHILKQDIISPADVINKVEIMTGNYDRENSGSFTISVTNAAGKLIAEQTVPVSMLKNNIYTIIPFEEEIVTAEGEWLTFEIVPQGCTPGNAITIYVAGSIQNQTGIVNYQVNGEDARGALCIKLSGYNNLTFYKTYWGIVIIAFVIAAVYMVHCWKKAKEGKNNPLVMICIVYSHYRFLIKQLVSRDFKTKYKRSSLGMAWSVMNPLLTMCVQYFVFSTLFKSDITNYPVYLLTGIVFFSFFNEAVSMGMTSIISNASLIKKVYMPKYIYPVTRVVSSLVNFGLALLPLFLVAIVTGTSLRPSMLLLVFDVVCYLVFIIGLTLLLATATTFFQDMQFLWGILSMVWQYLTPIFYPETIIPEQFLPLYRMNPLYQYVTFARTCIIDGISPAPMSYFWCIAAAAVMLILGIVVFKKHQDKFVLYL